MTKNDSEPRSVSGVKPYELPAGWKWTMLGEVCQKIKRGKSPKYVGKSRTLVFAQKCNQPDGTISLEKTLFLNDDLLSKYKENDFVKNGDVLINSTGTGTIGRVGYFNKSILSPNLRLVTDTHVTTVRCNDNNCPKFFYFFLKQKENYLELKGVGTTNMKELHADVLEKLPFPLPPTLAEQQRIVSRIESLFTKLDEAKDKAQSVVDGFELRRAAILHKAFTNQLKIENGKLKDGDWEEKSFSELGSANLGKMLDANKNTGDDVQYLRNVNVRWFDFDLSDLMTMKAKPEEIKKLSVKKADLFICEGGEPGRCAVWKNEDSDMIFQKAIHRFRPNADVSSDFIAYELYYLNQIGKLSEYFTGTTIKYLTGQSLAKIPIKLPPLNYQLSIVNFLDTVLEKESRAKEAAGAVLDQIALLKKSILARAFRGEI